MKYTDSVEFIRKHTNLIPKFGIILGTGLGNLIEDVEVETVIPYADIPGFLPPTIAGHGGNLVFGTLSNCPVIAMQGRNHFYEGHSLKQVTYPIRVMKLLGIETLITSNAVGGVNEVYEIGDIMIVTDHINLLGTNPLIGPNDDEFGTRFPDMSNVYDKDMILFANKIALNNSIAVHRGVLTALSGPTYETPAEYRMVRLLGADAVGMSTIPEVIVAKHCGLKCFSLSLVTDLGVPGKIVEITHDDVQRAAKVASKNLTFIIKEVVKNYR